MPQGKPFYIGLPSFQREHLAFEKVNIAGWRRPDRTKHPQRVLADGLSNVTGSVLGVPGMSIGPSLV